MEQVYRKGLPLDGFCEKLYVMRAMAKGRMVVTKTTMEPGKVFPTKRAMGYIFAVLEVQLR